MEPSNSSVRRCAIYTRKGGGDEAGYVEVGRRRGPPSDTTQ